MDEIRIDKIVRSRRRTIALIVTPEARVVVRAPLKAPASMIDKFVREQHGWIRKKIAEMKERPKAVDYTYAEGEVFWFLGRPYPLHVVDDGRAVIERTDRLCVSQSLVPEIRHRLKRWYMAEAAKEIH
jgi:predicted metal-dependent hydrolase